MKIIYWIKEHKLLLLIVLIATVFRIYHIDFQSVWLDEIHSLNESNPNLSFSEMYDQIIVTEPHPPLYFILLKITFSIFGYTTFVLRFFSALIGILSVYAIYKLGKKLVNKKVGLISALILSLNYFHIYHSQDGRMYSLLFFTTIMSFYFLIKFLKKPSYKTAIINGIFAALMIYTHFFALFALFSQYLILLYFVVKPYKTNSLRAFILTFISGLTTLILYLPCLNLFFAATKRTTIWIPTPGVDVYTQIFKEFFGNSELILFFILIILFYYFIRLFNRKNSNNLNLNPEKEKQLFSFFFLFLWIVITLIIPLVLSFINLPMIISRYFINILPAVIILVAIGVNYIKNDIVKVSIISFILIFSYIDITVVKNYYNTLNKAQFREVTQYIINNNAKNDPVVTSLSWYYPYFFKNEKRKTKVIDATLESFVLEMMNDSTKIKPFWYTDAHGKVYSLSEKSESFLKQKFFIDSNLDGYDSWTKHYELKAKQKKTVDISKYLPIKEKNGNEINFWIDKFNYDNDKLEVFGWAFLVNQNSEDSNIEIVLIQNNLAYIIQSESVIRKDITDSSNNEFNLDNSGFMVTIKKEEIPKGNFTLGIYIKDSKLNKEGLIVTDKIISKQ